MNHEVLEQKIRNIAQKQQQLLKRHAVLERENLDLRSKNAELQTKKTTDEKKIKALEEQYFLLKSAAGTLNSEDKKAFEKNLSRYIREIDKCIALLSE
jgi:chromosome segregation ATPase